MYKTLNKLINKIIAPKFFANDTVYISDLFIGRGIRTAYISTDGTYCHKEGAYFYMVILAITGEKYWVKEKFLKLA